MLALLGFDASNRSLRDEMVAEGRLPTLSGLLQRGHEVTLRTPASWLAASSYPTLWSGLEPGDHGLHYPFQWSARDQRVRPASAFPAPESFWERVVRAGRRALVVDPYEARRMQGSSAVCLSGVGFANRVTMQRWSCPPDALRAIQRGRRSPTVDEVFGRPSVAALQVLHGQLLAASDRVASVVCEAVRERPPDLLVACSAAVHLGGHQFWDTSTLAADGRRSGHGDGIDLKGLYEAADTALGRIVDALPSDADVIVFSPLGMAHNASRADLLPGMLDAVLRGGAHGSSKGGGGSLWRLRARVPTGLRASLARLLPDAVALEITARLDLRGVDWGRTRAFVVPNDHHGLIRLNLRGRERDGIVAAEDADALVAEIAAGLSTFRDPDGTQCVVSVDRSADVIPGGRRFDWLPDLVVRFADTPANQLDRVASPTFGEVVRAGAGSGRAGNHTDDAWALLAPGSSRIGTLAAPGVVDIAATAVAVLGGDADGLGGHPLLEPAE